jgi:hypothetical protein
MSIFSLVMSIVHLSMMAKERGGGITGLNAQLASNPISLLIAIYCLLAYLFTGALCGFHTFLISRGRTTHEQLKTVFPHGNPFSRDGFLNCIDVFINLPGRRYVIADCVTRFSHCSFNGDVSKSVLMLLSSLNINIDPLIHRVLLQSHQAVQTRANQGSQCHHGAKRCPAALVHFVSIIAFIGIWRRRRVGLCIARVSSWTGRSVIIVIIIVIVIVLVRGDE